MKKDKILLNISDINSIEKYKKLGISNFLFPLKSFSIGYPSFTIDEIKNIEGNIYILTNKLLTDYDIDEFLKLSIPKNVRGFVIEDVGLYEVLKNKGYVLINFQNHLNNNYETINYWLNYYDSLVISTDITRNEIELIIEKTTKPLVLNTFGYPMIMYSRRKLVSNFYKHLGKDEKKELEITEDLSNSSFFLKESDFGTSVFNNKCFDYRSLISLIDNKIKFYLINTAYVKEEDIIKVINGEEVESTTTGFLDKKTIYRIGDIK